MVVELIEQKLYGIFELLDNESRLPRPSVEHFTRTVHETHSCHPCLMVPFQFSSFWHLRSDNFCNNYKRKKKQELIN